MSKAIYLLQNDGQVIDMREQGFESEEFIQNLIAQHPDLLAGDQFNSASPKKFALVSREMGVTNKPDGSDKWAIDHVFVDQDCVLTIVEVKRSSDTRIRREVVGQMLDYASNAVAYLPIDKIKNTFEQNHDEPQQVIIDLLDEDAEIDYDAFWERVKINLQAGKLRLLFVADDVPNELRRIVEFLNKNMPLIDVLAIEIKQYVDSKLGLTTLVPRVIGQTAESMRDKSPSSNKVLEIKESVVVTIKKGSYRIDKYNNQAIKVVNLDRQQSETALPILREINSEKNLGIETMTATGDKLTTYQLGSLVFKSLKQLNN